MYGSVSGERKSCFLLYQVFNLLTDGTSLVNKEEEEDVSEAFEDMEQEDEEETVDLVLSVSAGVAGFQTNRSRPNEESCRVMKESSIANEGSGVVMKARSLANEGSRGVIEGRSLANEESSEMIEERSLTNEGSGKVIEGSSVVNVVIKGQSSLLKERSTLLKEGISLLKVGSSDLKRGSSKGNVVMKLGSSILKEGSSILKEGSCILKEGNSILKEGSSVLKEGSSVLKKESSVLKEGSSILKEGSSVVKSGSSIVEVSRNSGSSNMSDMKIDNSGVKGGEVDMKENVEVKVERVSRLGRNSALDMTAEERAVKTTSNLEQVCSTCGDKVAQHRVSIMMVQMTGHTGGIFSVMNTISCSVCNM